MLEIEEQLRLYGEAIEERIVNDSDGFEPATQRARRRHLRWAVPAAAAVLVLVGATAAFLRYSSTKPDSQVSTDSAAPSEGGRAGVFSTPTNTILLFSDGIDGVTAIDLDRRLAGRRAIQGERAGDQEFRLTLTDGHLVVGWGEIYAAPLDGQSPKRIADATIYVPASEPGEVWTLKWDGGSVGSGVGLVQRIRLDGSVVVSSDAFDSDRLEAVLGIPGGLLVNTAQGVAVWDADTGTTGPVLGPGPATAASSDGEVVAWCESNCEAWHVARLERIGPPTATHARVGQQIAISPEGQYLAALRAGEGGSDLVLTELAGSVEQVVATDLDVDSLASLHWTDDQRQLFLTEYSYGEASMRIGRYDVETRTWELRSVPVGGGLGAITLDPDQARSFFSDVGPENECSSGGQTFPSGRVGVCTFAF